MISQARLNANRLNAQKSTGPRTPEGKLRSSQNALTHGLTAHSSCLLPTEDPACYERFCQEMQEDLRPRSPMQQMLTERITNLVWRLRRLPNAEAELFNLHNQEREAQVQKQNEAKLKHHQQESQHYRYRKDNPYPPTPEPSPEPLSAAEILSLHFSQQDDKSNPFTRLHRYEASLERSLSRCMKQLQQLQKEQEAHPRTYEEQPIDDQPQHEEEEQIEPTTLHEPQTTNDTQIEPTLSPQSKIENQKSQIPTPTPSTASASSPLSPPAGSPSHPPRY